MGSNARRMAMNRQFNAENRMPGQRSPADMAQPTIMQDGQLAADPPANVRPANDGTSQYPFDPADANAPQSMRDEVANRQRMLGNGGMLDPASLAPPGPGNPMQIPGEGQVAPVAWQTQDGASIPVAQSAKTQSPPTSGAHASLCDGNCQHGAPGQFAAPGEVIGLPAFRFPVLPEADLLPGETDSPAVAMAAPAPAMQRPASRNQTTAPQPEAISVAPRQTVQVMPPSAPPSQPVSTPPAAAPAIDPSTSSRRTASNPAGQVPPATQPAMQAAPATSPPPAALPASVTMNPVRTTMQVRVTADDSPSPPASSQPSAAEAATSRAPQPHLPARATSSAPQVSSSTSAPPAQSSTTSAPANQGQSASAAGIRVDSSLKSPWSQPALSSAAPMTGSTPASQPSGAAPPVANPDQPAARILPFNPPTRPAGNPATGFNPPPSGFDSQVKPVGHQQAAPNRSTAAAIPASFSPPENGLSANAKRPFDPARTAMDLAGAINGMPLPLMANPAMTQPAGQTNQQLSTPRTPLPLALRANRPALTTEIRGYGDYEPMPSATLTPGQTVLVYCELENFVSSPVQREGSESFRTMLESRLVVTDPTGRVVQDSRFPPLDDYALSRRPEFFMYVPFEVGQLPAGNYQAQLEVRDLQGTSSTTSPVTFSVR